MRTLLFLLIAFTSLAGLQAQSETINDNSMKLNAGIITDKLAATKAFYIDNLGFGITFENDFYLLLHTPNHQAELSFLLANHSSQQPLFHAPFQGQGMFLTIELEDVDALYEQLKAKGIEILVDIRDEPWGDRHFAIQDPNGINIDLVRYTAPEGKE